MPLATLAQIQSFPLMVTFAAVDQEGVLITRQKQYEIVGAGVDAATRWTDAQANRDAFLADLGVASDGIIIKHQLSEVYGTLDNVVATPNLYREMLITFVLNGLQQKKAPHSVPAPSVDFVNGQALNFGHAAVSDYIANFTVTGNTVMVSDGEFARDANPVFASRVRQVKSGQSYT